MNSSKLPTREEVLARAWAQVDIDTSVQTLCALAALLPADSAPSASGTATEPDPTEFRHKPSGSAGGQPDARLHFASVVQTLARKGTRVPEASAADPFPCKDPVDSRLGEIVETEWGPARWHHVPGTPIWLLCVGSSHGRVIAVVRPDEWAAVGDTGSLQGSREQNVSSLSDAISQALAELARRGGLIRRVSTPGGLPDLSHVWRPDSPPFENLCVHCGDVGCQPADVFAPCPTRVAEWGTQQRTEEARSVQDRIRTRVRGRHDLVNKRAYAMRGIPNDIRYVQGVADGLREAVDLIDAATNPQGHSDLGEESEDDAS